MRRPIAPSWSGRFQAARCSGRPRWRWRGRTPQPESEHGRRKHRCRRGQIRRRGVHRGSETTTGESAKHSRNTGARKQGFFFCGHTAVNVTAFLLVLPTGLCAAQAAQSLHSRMCEGLMLAVAQSGEISGYYRESQGEGVTKTCSFFLSGRATSDQVSVTTWNTESFPGRLKPGDNGITLKIERGREHPGCGLVILPDISRGITLDLTLAANWITLRRISSPRANFFPEANAQQRLNAYVVKGDVVGVLSESPG